MVDARVGDGVAIVGIGCRFPGDVFTPSRFWEFMLDRGDGIVEVPKDRWNADLFYDPDPSAPGRAYTRHGGFVSLSPWAFDAEFFGVSPREAEVMDPQQRWVLEVAWEALDDAGIAGTVSGRDVGVYVGGFMSDNQIRLHMGSVRRAINSFTGTSSSLVMVSNRLSYALDLRGPSMTIDTACSSSLVAIHQATQALVRGECDIALAGGVNVMIHPEIFVTMCKGKFLSPDGRCKSFDAAADGYGRGEGAGMLVLKPVDAAVRDRDRIYAVIQASGANQDGRTTGITVPSRHAQRDLARATCERAGLGANEIGYVEAHGTGTAVGDPIEIGALGESYGMDDRRSAPLLVGSVKAAIGHLEAAAGVAGVIKAALAVKHRTIPPQARLDTLNPAIPFHDLNVEIVTQTTPFPTPSGRAVAAVNGFGYGGTNAHVILTEPPKLPDLPAARPSISLFPISAAREDAIRDVAASMLDTVGAVSDIDAIRSAAWSRRAHHQFRTVLPCNDIGELRQRLESIADGNVPVTRCAVAAGTKPVFVFSGMGPQWWGMGRELLAAGGPFAATAAGIDAEFTDIAGWSILDELAKDEATSRISSTLYAQPANFLIQVALVAELTELGIEPAAVAGHSVGEVSAAYVSGALTLRDALTVSYHRARLQATTDGTGGMLAVGLSEADAREQLSSAGITDVVVAADNGPESVTLAGPVDAIETLYELWQSADIFVRRLQVSVPYHSPLMDPILDDLVSALDGIRPRTPELALYSTVTAAEVTAPEFDARYWCANVREQVRFAETIGTLARADHRVFLEIGPHPVLSGNIGALLTKESEPSVTVGTLKRGEGERDRLVATVADLYRAGCLGHTAPGHSGIAPHVDLPLYPWQHKMLFSEPDEQIERRLGRIGDRLLLGSRRSQQPMTWSTELSATRLPWLDDHVVDGMVIVPGAAYVEAFLCAAAETTKNASLTVESVQFLAPLIVGDHAVPMTSVSVEPATMRLSYTSHDDSGLRALHSTARIVDAPVDAPPPVAAPVGGSSLSHDEFYGLLTSRGLHYGPAFRRVIKADISDGVIVTTIDAGTAETEHLVHPAIIDAALHGAAAFDDQPSGTMVPTAIGAVRRYRDTPTGSVTAVLRRREGSGIRVDITVSGSDGAVFLELVDVRFSELMPSQPTRTLLDTLCYEIEWRPVNLRAAPSRVDRPVLTVGIGPPAKEQAAGRLRRLTRRNQASASLRPEELADAIRALGAAEVTVLAVAGRGDAVELVADLVEIGRQLGAVMASAPDTDIDAVIVTTGAVRLPGDTHEPDPQQAALAGARRALQDEQLIVHWRHVDLAPGDHPDTVTIVTLNDVEDGEHLVDEIALRGGHPHAPYLRRGFPDRMEPYDQAAPAAADAAFVLEQPSTRLLADLALREVPRIAPEAGQVEVRMDTIGLNYKDPMKILGVLTQRQLAGTYFGTGVGMEGIGVITRTGGDTGFEVGDPVFVSARDMFRRYLILDPSDDVVLRLTGEVDPAFAGVMVPFAAARYGLLDVARLEEGETVLVHGGAGGTGLAAIQVARKAGATVIASAGTEERREYARAAGAHHTVNSRTTNFVDEVMRLTDGRGADVVYTSLPGEALRQNLRAAAEMGRVVDIGKADIYNNTVVELAPFDRNLQYSAVDIDRLFLHKRGFFSRICQEVFSSLNSGTYTAPATTVMGADQLPEAFDLVARGTQRGRVAVSLATNPQIRPAIPAFDVRADATYLVTGAFGAVGLAVTDWLVTQGAKRLIAVSRGGPRDARARRRLDAWRAAGAEVVTEAVDVGDARAVNLLIERAATHPAPLRGVFHIAGVAEDGSFDSITVESLRRVFGAKLGGAYNLHNATDAAGIDLDAFVLFSSVSAVVGFAIQVGYGAANAGLDALAQLRHSRGQAAQSINWGVLSGGGMAASAEVRRYSESLGNRDIAIGQLPMLMAAVLGFAPTMPNVMIADVDWRAMVSAKPSSGRSTRFAEFASALSAGDGGLSFRDELFALPAEQRLEVLTLVLADHVGAVLGIDPDTMDHHIPLPELGLDSLSSVELASRIAVNLDIRIPALEFGRQGGLAVIAKQALAGAERP